MLALIAHGAAGRDEDVRGAPVELLAVTYLPVEGGALARAQQGLERLLAPARVSLMAIEAHRLGWLPPSVTQQSLLAGGVLLWGDPAALRVIPSWRPDQLDPRLALDELDGAEAELAAGWPDLAVQRAAGALLIARRAYTARFDERPAALGRVWPEAPPMEASPADDAASHAARFVGRARALLHDWLFTWEGGPPASEAVRCYIEMWRRGRGARAAPRGGMGALRRLPEGAS
jgi:hypothetical protein